MSLDYNKKNIILAKNLRSRATPQEKRLWYDFLSKYTVRFQRQKTIDNFIADFYCHKASLIIEIDGSQHSTWKEKQKDDFRTEILEQYGLKIIRFTNQQIDSCLPISNIWKTIMTKYGILTNFMEFITNLRSQSGMNGL